LKYYQIQVQLDNKTHYIFQNVATGGFIYVPKAEPGVKLVENIAASLWLPSTVPGSKGTAYVMKLCFDLVGCDLDGILQAASYYW
jgi:hypothetical protein